MSQADPHTTTIGEHEYTMFMLPPMKSHKLLLSVSKMIGPTLGPVVDVFFGALKKDGAKDVMNQEVPAEFFSKAASTLFESVDEAVIDKVIAEFRQVTDIEIVGPLKGPAFDLHFLGNLGSMYQWIAWGMGVQWGNAFSALLTGANERGALLQAMMTQKKKKESPSPSTSTGKNGD